MTNQDMAVVEPEDGLWGLTMERHFDASIDEVWAALSEAEQLAQWLAETELEPRAGGTVRIRFSPREVVTGRVLAYEPPHVLEFEWGEGESDPAPSVVRFELRAEDGGTRLTLTHRRQNAALARTTGAGWHAHLEVLVALVHWTRLEWDDCYARAKPRYRGVAERI